MSDIIKPTHGGAVLVLAGGSVLTVLAIRPKDWLPTADAIKAGTLGKFKNELLLPKGHIEGEETALKAALRELREEAGISVGLHSHTYLGRTQHTYNGEECITEWYGIRTNDLIQSTKFERVWVPTLPANLTFYDNKKIAQLAVNWAATYGGITIGA